MTLSNDDARLLEYYVQRGHGPWNLSLDAAWLDYELRRYVTDRVPAGRPIRVCNVGIGVGLWDDSADRRGSLREARAAGCLTHVHIHGTRWAVDGSVMKADFTRCACSRINDPWRKFCGGCGRKLEPGCGGCGFVNARSDHFCGGCGDKVLVSRVVRATDEPSTIPIDIIEVVS